MHLQIPAELATFVAQKVASGRFASEQEVVLTALEKLRDDRREAIAGIREGLEQFQSGQGIPLDIAMQRLRSELGLHKQS
jgi:Arc/MetJ-type ribon-helix-helix transcriptional regulator